VVRVNNFFLIARTLLQTLLYFFMFSWASHFSGLDFEASAVLVLEV
jgi:hypothetical protein